jgi:hypothetical protein
MFKKVIGTVCVVDFSCVYLCIELRTRVRLQTAAVDGLVANHGSNQILQAFCVV